MLQRPFQAYEGSEPFLFVGYAREEAALVYPELIWLREAGLNLWYDDGIQVGRDWRATIADTLNACAGMLFMCTQRAADSVYCRQEVHFVIDRRAPLIVVELLETQLPPDLQLSLSGQQMLVRRDHSESDYRRLLLRACHEALTTSATANPAPAGALGAGRRLKEGDVCLAVVAVLEGPDPAFLVADVATAGGRVISSSGGRVVAVFDRTAAALELLSPERRLGLSCGDVLYEDGILQGEPIREALELAVLAGVGQSLCTQRFLDFCSEPPAATALGESPELGQPYLELRLA